MMSRNRYVLLAAATAVGIAVAQPTLAQNSTEPHWKFRQKHEVHLIVGPCALAGMVPLKVDGKPVVSRYLRAAGQDYWTEVRIPLGGTPENKLRQSDLPPVDLGVSDGQSVNIIDIYGATPDGDTAWIERGGRHPDRGNRRELRTTLNSGPQTEYLPEYLAVSFCSER